MSNDTYTFKAGNIFTGNKFDVTVPKWVTGSLIADYIFLGASNDPSDPTDQAKGEEIRDFMGQLTANNSTYDDSPYYTLIVMTQDQFDNLPNIPDNNITAAINEIQGINYQFNIDSYKKNSSNPFGTLSKINDYRENFYTNILKNDSDINRKIVVVSLPAVVERSSIQVAQKITILYVDYYPSQSPPIIPRGDIIVQVSSDLTFKKLNEIIPTVTFGNNIVRYPNENSVGYLGMNEGQNFNPLDVINNPDKQFLEDRKFSNENVLPFLGTKPYIIIYNTNPDPANTLPRPLPLPPPIQSPPPVPSPPPASPVPSPPPASPIPSPPPASPIPSPPPTSPIPSPPPTPDKPKFAAKGIIFLVIIWFVVLMILAFPTKPTINLNKVKRERARGGLPPPVFVQI